MKISEKWLREWVNPQLKGRALADALTMAGFEVESITPIKLELDKVVIAEIANVTKHPQADHLHVCEVQAGKAGNFTIVCGASNVRLHMKAVLALTEPKTIRGIASQGMLCSPADLHLADDNSGLMELPTDAPLGMSLKKYFDFNDHIYDISVMPNRGDCLSMRGMAREIAAITQSSFKDLKIKPSKPTCKDKLTIKLSHKKGCPHYVGRIIKQVNVKAVTPLWLQERLRQCGTRSINPIVDVTNYVMYELGQPMHAFDLEKIKAPIEVRVAHKFEKINLLDGSEKELYADAMLIADCEKPLAIAGVMGGLDSSVTENTFDIFLESAYFDASVVAQQRQYFNINSDSAYRFERSVDPELQQIAIERATQLIIEICGGKVGPLIEQKLPKFLPKKTQITLTSDKITNTLGVQVPDKVVTSIFKSLQCQFKKTKDKWIVRTPSFRFDLRLPEDLIEEIIRIYGLDKIPARTLKADLKLIEYENQAEKYQRARLNLVALGYHEIISYSFVSSKLQSLFDPHNKPQVLTNPITADMTVMRTNLWPGLINTLLYNRGRQQQRVRLFEIGTCFVEKEGKLTQLTRLAGLICGALHPEQWASISKPVDFFDLKGDVELLLKSQGLTEAIHLLPHKTSVLHPNQAGVITYKAQEIGILGALHPQLLQSLDIQGPVYLFEIDLTAIPCKPVKMMQDISKFPEIRRDIAIIVNEAVPAQEIQDTIRKSAGDWLKEVFIFDVYQGKGIATGCKSIALGLVIQHPERTLVDEEVTEFMDQVVTTLKGRLGAELRS